MAENEWLKVKEVAELLDVHPATVSSWVADGLFPGAIKLNPTRKNSHYRIPRQAFDAYVQSQVVKPANQVDE
jgi:excisionase family DNA binding protein